MKTIKNLLIALALIAAYSAFGQRQMPQEPTPPEIVNPEFTVELIAYKCSVKSNYAEAIIRQKTKTNAYYTFKWVVDGEQAGNASYTACTLSRIATVYVTQHPYGKTVSKTIRLKEHKVLKALPLRKPDVKS